MSSGIPSMFKTPKHRSFDYKPMFYDEQKERKAELERLVEEQRSGEISDERRSERLRGKLNDRWTSGTGSFRKKQNSMQQIRLIVILGLLVGLVWVFFSWI